MVSQPREEIVPSGARLERREHTTVVLPSALGIERLDDRLPTQLVPE
jgi:hypothetical protein